MRPLAEDVQEPEHQDGDEQREQDPADVNPPGAALHVAMPLERQRVGSACHRAAFARGCIRPARRYTGFASERP